MKRFFALALLLLAAQPVVAETVTLNFDAWDVDPYSGPPLPDDCLTVGALTHCNPAYGDYGWSGDYLFLNQEWGAAGTAVTAADGYVFDAIGFGRALARSWAFLAPRGAIEALEGASFDPGAGAIYRDVYRDQFSILVEDQIVWFNGYRNGTLVAEHVGGLADLAGGSMAFPDGFTRLDRLEIEIHLIAPGFVNTSPGLPVTGYNDDFLLSCYGSYGECSEFRADDLTLTVLPAVPLPASVLLLLTGVGGLLTWGRRARA
ncbi:MAG: hypothetical protein ACK5IB_02170 [Qingshengfaniella sp.]